MKLPELLYTYYGAIGYLFVALLGTCFSCKFIKLEYKKNYIFYILTDIFYAIVLSHDKYNIFIKIAASLIWGGCVVYLYDVLFSLINGIRKIHIIKKYPYFCCLMCFFSIYAVLNAPVRINDFVGAWYVVDYSLGIGSRFLVGSFLHLFFPDFISSRHIFWFCIISYLLTAALISYCFDVLIKKAPLACREILIFLVAFYVCSPFCITTYLDFFQLGRLEAHTLLFVILSVIIFFNVQTYWLKYSLITLLSCLSVAIYQGYVLLYYPMILITMIVSLLRMSKFNIKELAGPCFNVFSTALSFIYFQFFSFVKFDNSSDLYNALQKMTDMPISGKAINYEFFQSSSYIYKDLMIPMLSNEPPREIMFITLCLLLPIIIIFYHIYRTAWKYKKPVKWYKNEYLYCLLINFSVLPQFILNIDWGRWLIALGTMMFFEIFLLVYVENKGIMKALSKMNHIVKEHYFLCIILIIYLARLHALEATIPSFTDAQQIYKLLTLG